MQIERQWLVINKKKSTPALLLAAGLGSRLAPLTNAIPKCLVPIHGKPLLGIWFDMLGQAGLSPLFVNMHHHADAVEKYVKTNPWRKQIELLPEKKLRGTGGTLLAARDHLGGGECMVIHADNLSRFTVEDFLEAHRKRPEGCVMTMMLFRTPTPETCGIVELDSRGIVTAFYEKTEAVHGNLANGAVYVMEPVVFDILAAVGREQPDISLDLIPHCMGKIYTWVNDEYHRDIGTLESYQAALQEWK